MNDKTKECTFKPRTNRNRFNNTSIHDMSVFESTGVQEHVERQIGKLSTSF